MEVANLIRKRKTRQKMKAIRTTEAVIARPLHTFRMASFTFWVLVREVSDNSAELELRYKPFRFSSSCFTMGMVTEFARSSCFFSPEMEIFMTRDCMAWLEWSICKKMC